MGQVASGNEFSVPIDALLNKSGMDLIMVSVVGIDADEMHDVILLDVILVGIFGTSDGPENRLELPILRLCGRILANFRL